jgi:hypothetical protein
MSTKYMSSTSVYQPYTNDIKKHKITPKSILNNSSINMFFSTPLHITKCFWDWKRTCKFSICNSHSIRKNKKEGIELKRGDPCLFINRSRFTTHKRIGENYNSMIQTYLLNAFLWQQHKLKN